MDPLAREGYRVNIRLIEHLAAFTILGYIAAEWAWARRTDMETNFPHFCRWELSHSATRVLVTLSRLRGQLPAAHDRHRWRGCSGASSIIFSGITSASCWGVRRYPSQHPYQHGTGLIDSLTQPNRVLNDNLEGPRIGKPLFVVSCRLPPEVPSTLDHEEIAGRNRYVHLRENTNSLRRIKCFAMLGSKAALCRSYLARKRRLRQNFINLNRTFAALRVTVPIC